MRTGKFLKSKAIRLVDFNINKKHQPQSILDNIRRNIQGNNNYGEEDLYSQSYVAILAGYGTTATAINAALSCILRREGCLAKLRTEITTKGEKLAFSELRSLNYLTACILESMRLYPSVGMSLQRVVPDGGITVGGRFYPKGTIIGICPYVVHVLDEKGTSLSPVEKGETETNPTHCRNRFVRTSKDVPIIFWGNRRQTTQHHDSSKK